MSSIPSRGTLILIQLAENYSVKTASNIQLTLGMKTGFMECFFQQVQLEDGKNLSCWKPAYTKNERIFFSDKGNSNKEIILILASNAREKEKQNRLP